MRKRLIALMLMAVFAFEQTNVLTAFADEYDYMPIYDKYGNTVNVEDALSSRDAGNYVTIYDSAGNEVNIDDVVAEAEDRNKTNDSSSSSDNIYDNANSSGEYTPIYDELGNEVNPVDVLASEKTGINIPIYDDNGNTINPIDLEGKLYDLYGSEFRYIKVYDEAGNEIDWCGLLNNVEEWNARGFYTVTYVDSFDNSVIDTIVVPKDTSVTQIPTPPVHENYTFLTWIGNSNNVQKNETVTAVYLESTPKLDVFGYANGIEDYIEFYVYGTRTDYDGVLTSDLSQVNLKLSDYTWTDDMGNVFTPDEEGNFVDPRNGNKFAIYSESKVPDVTIKTPVSITTDTGTTVVTNNDNLKNLEKVGIKTAKNAAKDIIKGSMKALTKSIGIPILSDSFSKLILGVFGLEGEDDISKLDAKLDKISSELKAAEEELKVHTLNVAELTTQASYIQAVDGAASTMEEKIYGIIDDCNRGEFDEDECERQIAALYQSSEWNNLATALNNATSVLSTGNAVSYKGDSLIMEAYKYECGNVMFSKEAEQAITPYVLRQLTIYLKGYAVQNKILDACESTTKSSFTGLSYARNKMLKNTGGIVDGKFDPNAGGVVANFYTFLDNNYDLIFVDHSSNPKNHIPLKPDLRIEYIDRVDIKRVRVPLPNDITNFPLTWDQTAHLLDHVNKKHTTIEKYLSDLGFNYDQFYKERPDYNTPEVLAMLKNKGVYLPVGKQADFDELKFVGTGLWGINIYQTDVGGKFIKIEDFWSARHPEYFLTIRKDNDIKYNIQ